jgi:serine protease Do
MDCASGRRGTGCPRPRVPNAVSFIRAVEYCWTTPVWRLIGVALCMASSLAQAQLLFEADPPAFRDRGGTGLWECGSPVAPSSAATNSSLSLSREAAPAQPKPAPARRGAWPVALIKPVPTSIADLKSIETQVKALVARVSPAVVAIEVGYGTGSGVVITADGLALTAGHMCGRPNRDVRFTFPDGRTARGKTIGVDLDTDTGLMRITSPGSWPHVPVGDLDQARIGDWVLALGHPGGFDARRSLVTRLGRMIRLTPAALQTDCTISPGDSGGPLFDMEGRVIGIHSAITDSVAENFHVPITQYYKTWDALAKGCSPEDQPSPSRAYVGAIGTNDAAGCRLTAIEQNSPASKAGLKVGDVVLKVDGREVRAAASFRRWVAESEPGDTLNLEVKRGSQTISLTVKLERAPRRR